MRVRSVRPHQHRDPLPKPTDGPWDPTRDRPAYPTPDGETRPDTVRPTSGIDYLNLIADRHTQNLDRLTPLIEYSVLVETVDPNELAGQLQIPVADGGAR